MWYAVPTEDFFFSHYLKHAFKKIVRRGPDMAAMKGKSVNLYRYWIDVSAMRLGWQEPPSGDSATRAGYFARDLSMRHATGLRNADTLTGIAMAFVDRRINRNIVITTVNWRLG